jgi:hypothetical protein
MGSVFAAFVNDDLLPKWLSHFIRQIYLPQRHQILYNIAAASVVFRHFAPVELRLIVDELNPRFSVACFENPRSAFPSQEMRNWI